MSLRRLSWWEPTKSASDCYEPTPACWFSGADPLDLAGILSPGPKLAGLTRNRVLYRGRIPIALLEGGEVRFLETLEAGSEWEARKTLLRSSVPPPLTHLS